MDPQSRIHPNFRVIAIGLNPSFAEDSQARYISSSTGFSYHVIQPSSQSAAPIHDSKGSWSGSTVYDISAVLPSFVSSFPEKLLPNLTQAIVAINQLGLKEYPELRFSIRHLFKLQTALKGLSRDALDRREYSVEARANDNEEILKIFENLFLVKFLPSNISSRFYSALESCGYTFQNQSSSAPPKQLKLEVTQNQVKIGDLEVTRRIALNPEKVPNPLFYENPYQIAILKNLLQFISLDSADSRSLLVIGNQGVGKNKITDRMLSLWNAEREYTQLNRDTTLQSLLVTVLIENNKIKYIDSPLVVAMKTGRIAIIDEADKADNSVVSILKSIADLMGSSSKPTSHDISYSEFHHNSASELVLSDNRRMLTEEAYQSMYPGTLPDDDKFIVIHKDFRMIVLANRPGKCI